MSPVFLPAEREAFYACAEAALVREMGNVSILKFLKASDEQDAQTRWFGTLEAVLAELPSGLVVRSDISSGVPELVLRGEQRVRVDLWQLKARPSARDAWRIMARPGLAPVLLDVVADARWGQVWRAAIAAEAVGLEPVANPVREPSFDAWIHAIQDELVEAAVPDPLGWIVPAAPTEAPWPWFSDEVRARRVAAVLALGTERATACYVRLEQEEAR